MVHYSTRRDLITESIFFLAYLFIFFYLSSIDPFSHLVSFLLLPFFFPFQRRRRAESIGRGFLSFRNSTTTNEGEIWVGLGSPLSNTRPRSPSSPLSADTENKCL